MPIPDKAERSLSTSYDPPRTDLEKRLTQIWESVLDRERIGIHDNFFELGGHSIKAIRMVSKIQTELGIEIRLQDIFTAPSIAELAAKAEKSSAIKLSPIEPLPEQPYYDVSNAQKRLWLIDQMIENSVVNNMHAAYLLEGDLNIGAIQKAMKAIVNRHEAFRTVFISIEGEPKQKILDDVEFYLEYTDLTNEKDPKARAVACYREVADTPFNLEKGPLMRAILLKISESGYIMIFNIHHIIFDGWTHNIMMDELSRLYKAYCNGDDHNLPSLRIHYKDYSAWINNLLAGDAIKPHREYWLNKFSGDLPVLDFPLDYPRPSVQSLKGSTQNFRLTRN